MIANDNSRGSKDSQIQYIINYLKALDIKPEQFYRRKQDLDIL